MKRDWFIYAASRHYKLYSLKTLSIKQYKRDRILGSKYAPFSWYGIYQEARIKNPKTW